MGPSTGLVSIGLSAAQDPTILDCPRGIGFQFSNITIYLLFIGISRENRKFSGNFLTKTFQNNLASRAVK